MSTHPNAILLLTLAPDDLARKTYRAILEGAGVDGDDDIEISGTEYHHEVMESDYDENWQIRAKEGDIIVFDLFTYGYGERVAWSKLEAQKAELEAWAKQICEKHKCSYEIYVTANYW